MSTSGEQFVESVQTSDASALLLQAADLVTPIVIQTAVRLGIFDVLGEQTSCAELADRLGLDVTALARVLVLLRSCGLVEEAETGQVRVTPLGRVFHRDHPFSVGDAFALANTELGAWRELAHSVRTGSSAFEQAFGESHRTYRARHLDEDARLDRVHRAATRLDLLTLSRSYPWDRATEIVDIGGGSGMFLAGLLHRFPVLRGVLFELPRMLERATPVLDQYGVADRCSLVGGDFFERVPAGDLYVLKAVVGGWDDDACVRIMATIRAAIRTGGKLLVIEPVLGAEPKMGATSQAHLQLLVLYGGRIRAVEQYGELARAASFSLRNVVRRPTLSILEMEPC